MALVARGILAFALSAIVALKVLSPLPPIGGGWHVLAALLEASIALGLATRWWRASAFGCMVLMAIFMMGAKHWGGSGCSCLGIMAQLSTANRQVLAAAIGALAALCTILSGPAKRGVLGVAS